jgi:hypothetical protein
LPRNACNDGIFLFAIPAIVIRTSVVITRNARIQRKIITLIINKINTEIQSIKYLCLKINTFILTVLDSPRPAKREAHIARVLGSQKCARTFGQECKNLKEYKNVQITPLFYSHTITKVHINSKNQRFNNPRFNTIPIRRVT